MKHILSVAILCTLVFNFNAQVKLYIQPVVNMKTNQGSYRITDKLFSTNPFPDDNVITNNYFSFVNDKMFLDFNQINWGIKLGLNWKKNNFEINYSSDHSAISTGLLGFHYSTNPEFPNRISHGRTRYQIGSDYKTLSFDYDNRIFQSKNNIFELRIGAGWGLIFSNYKKVSPTIYDAYTLSWNIEPGVYNYKHEIIQYSSISVSPFLKASIGFDLKTKKDRNIVSFDVFYLQSLKIRQLQDHSVGIIDNGVIKDYRYLVSSKGSGFYFQISRKFQFYPWIPLSKKKRTASI